MRARAGNVMRDVIPDSELGARLESWIAATGQTKTEVAKQLGVTKFYISRVTNGGQLISYALVGRFCFEYGFGIARDVFGTERAGGKL